MTLKYSPCDIVLPSVGKLCAAEHPNSSNDNYLFLRNNPVENEWYVQKFTRTFIETVVMRAI